MNSISILGCGWLGLPLGRHLARSGILVKGSTTQASKLSPIADAGIEPYHLSFEPELVGDPGHFFSVDLLIINLPPRNIEGIANFHEGQLKAIRELARGKVRHILFISSTSVYPSLNKEVKEEDADVKCCSRSGISLLEMEHLFTGCEDLITTVIRFSGLYGPDRHPGRFLAGKKDLSGARNPVNMIHLEDCIGIIETIITKKLWGETFNACAPSEETRLSFYERTAHDLGVEAPTFTNEAAPFKKVNSDKLIGLTGYQFRY